MSLLVLCRLLISVTSTGVFPPALLMLVSQSSSFLAMSLPSFFVPTFNRPVLRQSPLASLWVFFLLSSKLSALQYSPSVYWWLHFCLILMKKKMEATVPRCPYCSNTGWSDQVYVWSVLHAATIDPLASKAPTEIQYSGTNPSTTELLRDQPLFSNPINSHVNVTLKSWPFRNPYIYNLPLSPTTSYINTPKIERVTHKTESRQRYHTSAFSSFTWM